MSNQDFEYAAQFNQWTRNHDDNCSYDIQKQMSEKPIKYITYVAPYKGDNCEVNIPGSLCGGISHVGSNGVDIESGLRSSLTNKREIVQLTPAMFLSQPYKGNGEFLGDNYNVDINTKLRSDPTKVDSNCVRPEVAYYTPHLLNNDPQVGTVIPDGWVNGGRSSRVDMRELHNQVCKSNY